MIIELILNVLLLLCFWFVIVLFILFMIYGHEFKRLWMEPMLRCPVVIFESDDWGGGPKEQVQVLADLLQLFLQYQDQKQHHPVLTLGMILAEPDVEQIKLNNEVYYSRDLSNECYRELVDIINKGERQKVFSSHLHGMEHFWPDSLMNSLKRQEVFQWLFDSDNASNSRMTEKLPSFLQSRWCDSSNLPSTEHKERDIAKSIEAEKRCFKRVFEKEPKVVVPPTFVWTEKIIKHYILHGINTFVTPGRQFTGRDEKGELKSNDKTFYGGDIDQETGALYLVRDVYFEPELGHKANRVIAEIINRRKSGRASLIEMHRFNFLSGNKNSINELKSLLDKIIEQLPDVRFLSVEDLAIIYRENNGMLYQTFSRRFRIWLHRVRLFLQFKRVAKYSGFNNMLNLITMVK